MQLKGVFFKISTIGLLLYTIIAGFLLSVPDLPIVEQSIRNLYFHVPMWFGMIFLFFASVIYAIRYLYSQDLKFDSIAIELVNAGLLFGILGMVTGMVWAEYTWTTFWSNDPKQLGSAIALLIYLAFLVLRSSIVEDSLRAKVSSVYNIFAFACMIPLLFILPRMTDSLHPGNGGNPGFNAYDLDSRMRIVFYPAVLGWTMLGFWLASLRIRLNNIQNIIESDD